MAKSRKNRTKEVVVKESFGTRDFVVYFVSLLWMGWVLKQHYSAPLINLDFAYLFNDTYFFQNFNIILTHLLNLSLSLAAAYAIYVIGGSITGFFKMQFQDSLESFVFSESTGFVIIYLYVTGLSSLGLVNKYSVYAAVVLPILYSVIARLMAPKAADVPQKPAFKLSAYFSGPADIIVTAMLLFILAFNLVASLSPEIFYDTLLFHLGVPNQYKLYHGFTYLPFNAFSNMPMAHGMIYLFGLVLKDEIIAKLFNYFASVLIVLSMISFCRRFFNYRTGLWAAAVFYSIFQVAVCSWQAGTEMFLTLFTFLSVYLILLHEDTEWKYLALSGIFSGMCMALKYTGIYAIFVNLVVLLFKYRKVTWPYVKNAVLMGVLAAAVLSPWLVKNYVYVKNPVYPFATNVFPLDKNSDPAGLKNFVAETQQKAAFNLKDWLMLPFDTNTGKVPNNEFFTPLFLAILPFGWLLVKNRSAVYKLLYAYFGIFYLLWSFSTTVVRYLMPALPVGAVLIAFSLLWKKTDLFKKLILGVMIFSFYASFLAGAKLFYIRDCWKVFFGYETKEEFLTNTSINYPSGYYDMAAWLNENTKPGSRILLFGDARTLYYERKILANSVFDRNALSDYLARSRSEDELRDNLKKDGIGYIALNVVEAIRTMKDYKNFKMTDEEIVLYRKFFDKYMKEVYSKNILTRDNRLANKLVVYEIGANPGPKQPDYITGAVLPQIR